MWEMTWCIMIHLLCSVFQHMTSQKQLITSKYYFLVMLWFFSTYLWCTIIWQFKKTINITLTFLRTCYVFLPLGEVECLQWWLWHGFQVKPCHPFTKLSHHLQAFRFSCFCSVVGRFGTLYKAKSLVKIKVPNQCLFFQWYDSFTWQSHDVIISACWRLAGTFSSTGMHLPMKRSTTL